VTPVTLRRLRRVEKRGKAVAPSASGPNEAGDVEMTSNEAVAAAGIAPGAGAPPPVQPMDPFDLDDLSPKSFRERLLMQIFDEPQWLMCLLRRFKPIATLGKTVMVTRYDDVQEVLRRDKVFGVPFGPRVALMNGGPNFLLGMPASQQYWHIQREIMSVFRREDVAQIVAPLSARFANEIVEASGGRLDAIESLISRIPTLICEHYYGVEIAGADPERDRVEFVHWSLAMSSFTFGNPNDSPFLRRAALAAAQRVRPIIDRSIAAAKNAAGRDDIIARLVGLQKAGAPGLSDLVIRSYIIGMITGFVPTDTLAAGKALEQMLRRPDILARCQAAARAGDDELLRRCIRETMRFKPIFPGPQRVCLEDCIIAEGTGHAKRIKKGTPVLPMTQSAMFDERRVNNPYEFDPDRPAADYMLFGHGLHWCIGAFIAEAQITQTLKALLVRPGLRRAPGEEGQLKWFGTFPGHLWVEFDR